MEIAGVNWYAGQKAKLDRDVQQCLEMTAAEVVRDLRASHTLPRREGELTKQTYVDRSKKKGVVSVVTDTNYARRLYFHPEYQFDQTVNEAAGGEWFEPYKERGSKSRFCARTFSKFLKQRRG